MIFQRQRFVLIALLVAGAFFMENLDGTVIATALPQMAPALRTTPIALSAGMSAYMLTLAVFIPISGWVADRYGTRRVFASAIGGIGSGSMSRTRSWIARLTSSGDCDASSTR